MSWSAYGIPVPEAGRNLLESITDAIDRTGSVPQYQSGEVQDQIRATADVVQLLIESGAVGEGPFVVHLSGHANPEHKPCQGYANDMLSVTISLVGSPVPAPDM